MSIVLKSLLQTKLTITPSLRQALDILQMPQTELASFLQEEVSKNPLLEMDRPSFRFQQDASLIAAPLTLHEFLMQQIREYFPSLIEKDNALSLLEQLDERGFLPEETPDSPTLSTLQRFDPPGIFARTLRECFLLQLDPTSLAFQIVSSHFQELLRGRFKEIQKKTGVTDLGLVFKHVARLISRPATLFTQEVAAPIVADLSISKNGDGWIVSLNDDELPKIYLQSDYSSLVLESQEEKKILRSWMTSAKWLLRALTRRKQILLKVGIYLTRKQALFLDQKEPLAPLSLQELAHQLLLHESTLSRALMGKYAATPRGLLPLRSFLSSSPSTEMAKYILQKLIATEDQDKPMSDGEITAELKKQGMKLSRRTVAKYRKQLEIAPAPLRKYLKS